MPDRFQEAPPNGKRITLRRQGLKRRVVIVAPPSPFPKIGENITERASGLEWEVVAIENCEYSLLNLRGPHV
jgi:hypothetical protein